MYIGDFVLYKSNFTFDSGNTVNILNCLIVENSSATVNYNGTTGEQALLLVSSQAGCASKFDHLNIVPTDDCRHIVGTNQTMYVWSHVLDIHLSDGM